MKSKLPLVICLLAWSVIWAQDKLEIEAKEFFWGADDAYSNVTEVPDKWQNESAVILYKNENYDFHKYAKNVTYKVSVRKRIKLLDKAAVDEFSEFNFQKQFHATKGREGWRTKGSTIVAVKVIKPDGSVNEIDVEAESVEVDGEIKLAVSNLEVDDIIDFYFYSVEPFKSKYAFGFDPVETTLAEEYPIVDYKLYFETENDFFINFNSFNGAPELEQIPTDKGNFRKYELTASHIDKIEHQRWFYPLVELPSYKFQVYFARSGKFENMAMAFLPEKENIIKTSVAPDEVLDLYDTRFRPDGDIGDVRGFLKDKSFASDTDKVTQTYYYMRHYYMTRYLEAFMADQADIVYPYYFYGNNPVFIQDEKQFVKHFTEFLRKQNINYEIVVAKKRYDGTIEQLLIEKNVNVLLKVYTETPLYVEFFGPHTSVNQYSPLIEGTDILLLTNTKAKIDGIKKGNLAVSSYLDNKVRRDLEVNIGENFDQLSIKTTNSFTGHAKEDYQYDLMTFADYVNEDYQKYGTKSLADRIKKKSTKQKVTKEMNALIEKLKSNQKERFKQFAETDFEDTEVDDFEYEITNTGRYGFDSEFTFTNQYTVKDVLIKKAGPNYIMDIGKLIGGQITIDENERVRNSNIYMEFPRTFEYNITLLIPDGFTVAGLENLSKTVDNETGAFISTAEVVDNQLIVKTTKQYKNNIEPGNNWSKMIEFLDEAKDFTNEKVLLKKL